MAGRPAADSTLIKAWIPRDLHRDLSIAATAEGLRMSQYVIRAIRRDIAGTNRRRASDAA